MSLETGWPGSLDHWKRGGASLQQRPNYRLVNTGIGPSAPWVLSGDDLSGDIYQCGWVDALPSDAPRLGSVIYPIATRGGRQRFRPYR